MNSNPEYVGQNLAEILQIVDEAASSETESGHCLADSFHTDGSDIEIITEEKDSSDSIEVLDTDRTPDYINNRGSTVCGNQDNHLLNMEESLDLKEDGSATSNGHASAETKVNTMQACDSEHMMHSKNSNAEALDALIDSQMGSLALNSNTNGTDVQNKTSTCTTNRLKSDAEESVSEAANEISGEPASHSDEEDFPHPQEVTKDGDDSSTDSLSMKTLEGATPEHSNVTQSVTEQGEIDMSSQSPLHGVSQMSSSFYATSDSDSSCYDHVPSSSDYEGYPFTQIDGETGAVSNGSIPSTRPDSLSLPRPLQYYERRRLVKRGSESSVSEYSRSSSTDALIEAVSSTPLHTQGTVTKDGEMIAFVAEGLTQMIKMSSPLTKSGKNPID